MGKYTSIGYGYKGSSLKGLGGRNEVLINNIEGVLVTSDGYDNGLIKGRFDRI